MKISTWKWSNSEFHSVKKYRSTKSVSKQWTFRLKVKWFSSSYFHFSSVSFLFLRNNSEKCKSNNERFNKYSCLSIQKKCIESSKLWYEHKRQMKKNILLNESKWQEKTRETLSRAHKHTLYTMKKGASSTMDRFECERANTHSLVQLFSRSIRQNNTKRFG